MFDLICFAQAKSVLVQHSSLQFSDMEGEVVFIFVGHDRLRLEEGCSQPIQKVQGCG